MENRMFGVVFEWFIRIYFIYLGSYCRKALYLVGVAQASTL